jgi:hypothetical protein
VLWFEADAIPSLGTTSETQITASAPDEAMVLAEGEPILAAYSQADAKTLQIVLNLRAYVAAIPLPVGHRDDHQRRVHSIARLK